MTIAIVLGLIWCLAALLFAWRSRMDGRGALIAFALALAAWFAVAFAWPLFSDRTDGRVYQDSYVVFAFQEYLLAVGVVYLAGFGIWWGMGRLRVLSPSLPGAAFWLMHVGAGLPLLPPVVADLGLLGTPAFQRVAVLAQQGAYAAFASVLLTGFTALAVLFGLLIGRGGRR